MTVLNSIPNAIADLLANHVPISAASQTISGCTVSASGTVTCNGTGFPLNNNPTINIVNGFPNQVGVDNVESCRTWGTIALTTSEVNKGYLVSYRTQFNPKGWNSNMTDMWDDFSDDGVFENKTFDHKVDDPRSALSVKLKLGPHETREVQFLLTGHFPNRKDWDDKVTIGNYYSTIYTDAWDVAETLPHSPGLEAKTLEFVNSSQIVVTRRWLRRRLFLMPALCGRRPGFRTKMAGFLAGRVCLTLRVRVTAIAPTYGTMSRPRPSCLVLAGEIMREIEYNYGEWDSGLVSFRVRCR